MDGPITPGIQEYDSSPTLMSAHNWNTTSDKQLQNGGSDKEVDDINNDDTEDSDEFTLGTKV